MGFLTMIGTVFGAYIMSMAALSPCPLLVHSTSGVAIIVRHLFLLSNFDFGNTLMHVLPWSHHLWERPRGSGAM